MAVRVVILLLVPLLEIRQAQLQAKEIMVELHLYLQVLMALVAGAVLAQSVEMAQAQMAVMEVLAQRFLRLWAAAHMLAAVAVQLTIHPQ